MSLFSSRTALFSAMFTLGITLSACKQPPADTEKDSIIPPAAQQEKKTVVKTDDSKGIKRYGVRSGIVKYTVSNDMMDGTEELYFDDWGKREMKETKLTMSMGGMQHGTHQRVYMRDGYIYSLDVTNNTGTKTADEISKKMMEGSNSDDMKEVGDKVIKALNGVKTGKGNVAGHDCDKYTIKDMGSEACAHKGVTLNAVTNMNGFTMSYEASEAAFDIDVPADKLDIPTDVQWKEVDAAKMMQMINDL